MSPHRVPASTTRRARLALLVSTAAIAFGATACEPAAGGQGRVNAQGACQSFQQTIDAASAGTLSHEDLLARLERIRDGSAMGTPTMEFAASQMLAAAESGHRDDFIRAVADMTLSCELTGN